jgi:ribosomal protein S27E
MKWHECLECEEEFRVMTESLDSVVFCPLCGTELEEPEVEEDEDFDSE